MKTVKKKKSDEEITAVPAFGPLIVISSASIFLKKHRPLNASAQHFQEPSEARCMSKMSRFCNSKCG